MGFVCSLQNYNRHQLWAIKAFLVRSAIRNPALSPLGSWLVSSYFPRVIPVSFPSVYQPIVLPHAIPVISACVLLRFRCVLPRISVSSRIRSLVCFIMGSTWVYC